MGRPLLLLLCLFACPAAIASTFVIDPYGTGDYPTIQAAVDAAVDGDTIVLTDGIFADDGNRDVNLLGKSLTIRSQSGVPENCCIDCGGDQYTAHRAFLLDSAEPPTTTLEGIRITNGAARVGDLTCGGAICVREGASVTLRNLVLDGNTAINGGALAVGWGQVTIENVTFRDNDSPYTAGALYGAGANLQIDNCTFVDNSAADCGAIRHEGNFVGSHCLFVGNWDGYSTGAACFVPTSTVTIEHFTFVENYCFNGPGSLGLFGTTATIENSIIAFGPHGSAVDVAGGGSAQFLCTDIYGNAGGDWVDEIADQLGVNGNISEDPEFCDPVVRDFTLWNSSPCAMGECGLMGALPIGCWEAQAVDTDFPEGTPLKPTRLAATWPNPFAQATGIRYSISPARAGQPGALRVFAPSGRAVRTLYSGPMPEGEHLIEWDGTNDLGHALTSGSYYCRLRVGNRTDTQRLLLIRP